MKSDDLVDTSAYSTAGTNAFGFFFLSVATALSAHYFHPTDLTNFKAALIAMTAIAGIVAAIAGVLCPFMERPASRKMQIPYIALLVSTIPLGAYAAIISIAKLPAG